MYAGEVLWTYTISGIEKLWQIWHTLGHGAKRQKASPVHLRSSRGFEGDLTRVGSLKMISPDDPSVAPLRKDLQEKIDELEGKSATHPERKAAA